MRNKIISFVVALSIVAAPAVASAHVAVTPSTVAAGAETTYNVSVPNERQVAVTKLRLAVPSGVTEVTPTVHSGWAIATETSGGRTTAIVWGGGEIPAGQRDDFSFSAVAPATNSRLAWKAYQTYADGTVVSWVKAPGEHEDDSSSPTTGPYTTTAVQSELKNNGSVRNDHSNLALLAALAAIALSAWSVVRLRVRSKNGHNSGRM